MAHWAASSGALASCVYLAEEHGVAFDTPNAEGNTPLAKAVVHSRAPVVRWLLETRLCDPTEVSEAAAMGQRLASRRPSHAGRQEVAAILRAHRGRFPR